MNGSSSQCDLIIQTQLISKEQTIQHKPNSLFSFGAMPEIDILHMLLFFSYNVIRISRPSSLYTSMWTSVCGFVVLIIARQEHRIVAEVGRPLDIRPNRS